MDDLNGQKPRQIGLLGGLVAGIDLVGLQGKVGRPGLIGVEYNDRLFGDRVDIGREVSGSDLVDQFDFSLQPPQGRQLFRQLTEQLSL